MSFSGRVSSSMREVGIVASVAVLVYLFIVLFSYSPSDPGPTTTGDGTAVRNLGGSAGAWIADLLYAAFGRMSFLFVMLLALVAWNYFFVKPKLRQQQQPTTTTKKKAVVEENGFDWLSIAIVVAGVVMAMIGACSLETIYFPISSSVLLAGGAVGQFFGAFMSTTFGIVGATILFLTLFVVGVTLISDIEWFHLMDRVGYALFAFVAYLKSAYETYKDRRKGQQVRKERTESVKEFRQVIEDKKPPKIEPRVQSSAPQEVAVKKRPTQQSLFSEAKVSGSLPSMDNLELPEASQNGYSKEELEAMSVLLIKKLKDFNLDVSVEAVQPGPVITRFEIEPAAGIKASQIVGLAKDLARSLSVTSIRVVENIPGKTVIGIEIPNQSREVVRLIEGLSSPEYNESKSPLTLILGKDIAGNTVIADIMKMPHVLIAGTTGSGKSVCINALILSLVFKSTPEQVRMIMVDPKFLELSVYDGIPHLLAPVVTDMNKASNALRWCIVEMDRRFRLMAQVGVRNITSYNKKVDSANKAGQPIPDPSVELEVDQAPIYLQHMPLIVVVVDELADLLMVVGKKIEEIITRIAQRARAAGIHLVLATQRPSVDVVTGLIKANIPTRIAFQVSSRGDSRTVLDQMGAEQLLGQGDMLYLPPGTAFTQRVHGSFVSDEEVTKVVNELKAMGQPEYLDEITNGADTSGEGGSYSEGDGEADPLYDDAVAFVTQSRKASISAVQRALRVGYNRAARMVETMEAAGVVTSSDNGKREVLAPPPVDE